MPCYYPIPILLSHGITYVIIFGSETDLEISQNDIYVTFSIHIYNILDDTRSEEQKRPL
jgi:hypothetical protein